MGIKLHGLAMSTNTSRVMVCLHEKDVDFELVPVNVFSGEHKLPPFLSKNPFGLIPVLEDEDDDDLTLFGICSISLLFSCLAEKYKEAGPDLIRKNDPKEAALVRVWAEVESQSYDPAISPIIFEYLVSPFQGKDPNQSVIDASVEKLKNVLDVYEARLSKTKYLAGDFFSLADLNHITNTHYFMKTSCAHMVNDRPRVKAWWEDISSRPSFQKIVDGLTFGQN